MGERCFETTAEEVDHPNWLSRSTHHILRNSGKEEKSR
jgi:hypothetical protein